MLGEDEILVPTEGLCRSKRETGEVCKRRGAPGMNAGTQADEELGRMERVRERKRMGDRMESRCPTVVVVVVSVSRTLPASGMGRQE
jgi:hypothetical protein